MGLIKEPEGVDFVIQSPPLTEKERSEISEFIRAVKLHAKSKAMKKLIKTKRTLKNVKEIPDA